MCPWLFFTWKIPDANEKESKIVNWLDVSGSSIGSRNLAFCNHRCRCKRRGRGGVSFLWILGSPYRILWW